MDIFIQLLVFVLEAIVIVAAVLIILSAISGLFIKEANKSNLRIKKLNRYFSLMKKEIDKAVLSKKERRAVKKIKSTELQQKIFVLTFSGDMRASAVEQLREDITALLTLATPIDEVILRLESAGGLMHSYGLAASQLLRLRSRGIPLTVCIDRVAASGGYLMAAAATRIIAAPFAIIGSIGVLAQLPNFHRWLQDRHIDFEQITAGKFKRTLSLFGKNTEEAREKFQSDLEEAHHLFKGFIKDNRATVDVEEIATGEYWFAKQAIELNLVDTLNTSDDYLLEKAKTAELFELYHPKKKRLADKFFSALSFQQRFLL